MKYVSTRDRIRTYTGAEAIVKGISDDGGLIVPSSFPVLNEAKFDALLGMDYPERAASVLHEYLDEFSFEELLDWARNHMESKDIPFFTNWVKNVDNPKVSRKINGKILDLEQHVKQR